MQPYHHRSFSSIARIFGPYIQVQAVFVGIISTGTVKWKFKFIAEYRGVIGRADRSVSHGAAHILPGCGSFWLHIALGFSVRNTLKSIDTMMDISSYLSISCWDNG